MKKPRFKEDKQVDYWVYAYKKESKFVQFQWNQSFHIDFLQHLSHHHIDISLILNSLIGEGNGNPLQCSCLENSMGGGAWQAAVHGVTESQTWLNDQHTHKLFNSTDYIICFLLHTPGLHTSVNSGTPHLLLANWFPTLSPAKSSVSFILLPLLILHR